MIPALSPRFLYIVLLSVAAATLVSVFVMEYGFGLKPCELCTFQRIPYAIIFLLSAIGLAMPQKASQRLLLGIIALLFLGSVGLGVYHVGVEKKWFPGPSACTSDSSGESLTAEELRARILAAPVVACDQPQWEWNGVTLAGLNVVWSGFWFLFTGYGFLQTARRKHA